jgi:putative transposase
VALLRKRAEVYEAAKAKHPERWSGDTRNWKPVTIVHLNPEKLEAIKIDQKEQNPELKIAA